MLFKHKAHKLLILLSLLVAITACAPTQPAPTAPRPVVVPTLVPGQLAFTPYNLAIPLPADITENSTREMPGVGFTGIYNAPTLTEATVQTHFDELMPQLGFTPLGKIGPNLTYKNDEYTLRIQLPGDGFLILTMLQTTQ